MTFVNPDVPGKGPGGRNQKPLLLVLLALVAVFAYLYFFTGLIKPRQEEQPAPPPVAVVKKPLPPRPEGEAGTPGSTAKVEPGKAPKVEAADQKATSGEPAASVKSPATPAPAPAATAPEKPSPAKPAAAPAKKEAAKPAAPQTGGAKPAASVVAAKVKKPEPAAKSEAAPAKPATAKTAGAKVPATKESAKAAPAKKEVAVKESGKGEKKSVGTSKPVTLFVGEFVPDKEFLALQARLKKMGLSPLHRSEVKKAKPMNRLFVGEYANYDAGSAELERVKKLSGDAFFIENKGTYRVYAGSYYSAKMAGQVKAGLAGKGVSTTLQKAEVPVTVVRLTAGRFADKGAAGATIKKLKAAGLSPTVVQLAK